MADAFGANRAGRKLVLLALLLAAGMPVLAAPHVPDDLARCGPIPPAPVDLQVSGFYADSGNDGPAARIDPARYARYLEAIAPLTAWGQRINQQSDRYLQSGDHAQARCALAFLDDWAQAGALLGQMGDEAAQRQGEYERQWHLAQAAAVYFKVMALATPAQDARIRHWLAQLAQPVKAFWDQPRRQRNNHYAWSGVGVMQTSFLNANPADRRWARQVFDEVLDGLRPDGFHPAELRRGSKALHYHLFMLAPLLHMAKLSQLSGENWLADARLQRMIAAVSQAAEDPSIMEKITGKVQESFAGHPWGWGCFLILPDDDPRQRRFKALIRSGQGSPSVRYLGGNQALLRMRVDQCLAQACALP